MENELKLALSLIEENGSFGISFLSMRRAFTGDDVAIMFMNPTHFILVTDDD